MGSTFGQPKTGVAFSAQDYLMGLAQGSGAKIPVAAEKSAVKSEPAAEISEAPDLPTNVGDVGLPLPGHFDAKYSK